MKYGLIGKTLAHSYSEVIHKSFGYEYELCELSENELPSFIKNADFNAINVTIPYKQAVIPYLYDISDEARRIGAVNTVVRDDKGKLHGYNTDYFGFDKMCGYAGISFEGKKVLVLGSGGTSLTARTVIKDRGASSIFVISRHGEDNYDNIARHSDADIIVNTTPVGMFPSNGVSPVDLSVFPHLSGVLDVIYNPRKTALILDAAERGLAVGDGLKMLFWQGAYSSSLFFGRKFEAKNYEGTLKALDRQFSNIVLVGMPGSGKTEIGKLLAARLGMPFIDTDAEIIRRDGRDIPSIFAEEGEEYFRALETKVTLDVTKFTGQVISCGGGTPMIRKNLRALRQNGTILYIERPTELLARDGRPKSVDVEKLANDRIPVYNKISDKVFRNNSTLKQLVDIIVSEL